MSCPRVLATLRGRHCAMNPWTLPLLAATILFGLAFLVFLVVLVEKAEDAERREPDHFR